MNKKTLKNGYGFWRQIKCINMSTVYVIKTIKINITGRAILIENAITLFR